MRLFKSVGIKALVFVLLFGTFFGINPMIANANEMEEEVIELPDLLQYLPTDLDENHWAFDYLSDFIAADLLKGYQDSEGNYTIQADKQITRAEFVTIVIRALELTDQTNAKEFDDVDSDDWFYQNIQIASANGLVNGISETEFAPNEPIKRDEITAIVVRAFANLDYESGTPIEFADVPEYWATEYINKASSAGIVNGKASNEFEPDSNATRAESVAMLYRALNQEESFLPEDEQLINAVNNYFNEVDAAYNSFQFEQVTTVNNQYTMGLFKVIQNSNNEIIKAFYEMGIESTTELTMEPTYNVSFKSDRFAVVDVEGLVYDNHYILGEDTETVTQDLSGSYYLRKTNGEWKIYMAVWPNLIIEEEAAVEDEVTVEDETTIEEDVTIEDEVAFEEEMAFEEEPAIEEEVVFEEEMTVEEGTTIDEDLIVVDIAIEEELN